MDPSKPYPKKVQCGLQACLRHSMRLCRWAGYFPVQGLDQNSAEGTKFQFRCLYIIYHMATIIGQMGMTCFSLIWVFDSDITYSSLTCAIFYGTGLISAILFTRLAHKWSILMKKAEEIEQSLTKLKIDANAVRQSNVIPYIILVLAVVEHGLFNCFHYKYIMECLHKIGFIEDVFEDFMKLRMPFIFKYLPYNIFIGVIVEFLSLQATFIWSFTDVTTICFSIYITSYFKSLNKYISCQKNKTSMCWRQLHEHYSKLVVLVKEIDNHISSFILLSFFTDLFFICKQLFSSLHQDITSFEDCDSENTHVLSSTYLVYYLYSVLFLILRSLLLSLFASNVHSVAQESIVYVYDVSESEYDREVRRFQSQLRLSKVALSGKFFHITRSTVLQAIGTIITYELVLLQFSVEPHINAPIPTSLGTLQMNLSTTEAH